MSAVGCIEPISRAIGESCGGECVVCAALAKTEGVGE